jgi:hypothetical protein
VCFINKRRVKKSKTGIYIILSFYINLVRLKVNIIVNKKIICGNNKEDIKLI